jgi:outer membrane lipoprotein-sorting protein
MRRLRTLPTRRLAALIAAIFALAVTAGIAQAALLGSDPKPQPKPLDRALRDALNAPAPAGVQARITFTNGLIPTGAGGGPLLAGATGRLWAAGDGRLRLELQSDRGDARIVVDHRRLSVYDATSNTLYRMALPQARGERPERELASLADVRRGLERLAGAWALSGARPTSTGGRPTYTLRIAPKDDGGLLGAGELAWDAERGVPLRAALYAQGQSDPVLELEATDVDFGRVDDADLRMQAPASAKVVAIDPPAHESGARAGTHGTMGVDAVRRHLDFALAAPAELAGLPRKQVRLVRFGGANGALSVYGEGLGGIVVLQRPAAGAARMPGRARDASLPQINIDGTTGTELATALGTLVTFERAGVSYTVLGSVPPVAAENAARDLR